MNFYKALVLTFSIVFRIKAAIRYTTPLNSSSIERGFVVVYSKFEFDNIFNANNAARNIMQVETIFAKRYSPFCFLKSNCFNINYQLLVFNDNSVVVYQYFNIGDSNLIFMLNFDLVTFKIQTHYGLFEFTYISGESKDIEVSVSKNSTDTHLCFDFVSDTPIEFFIFQTGSKLYSTFKLKLIPRTWDTTGMGTKSISILSCDLIEKNPILYDVFNAYAAFVVIGLQIYSLNTTCLKFVQDRLNETMLRECFIQTRLISEMDVVS